MKKIILTLAVLITAFISYAQVDSVRLEQDKIFQYINKTLIPKDTSMSTGLKLLKRTG